MQATTHTQVLKGSHFAKYGCVGNVNRGQNGCSVGHFCVWSFPLWPLPPFYLALVTFLGVCNSRLVGDPVGRW